MVPSTPSPSARLLRAAAAEREDLARHRDRLVTAREQLREELARIDASLHEVDERARLLDRLAGPETTRPGERPTAVDRAAAGDAGHDRAADRAALKLRGPAIRRAAVEALLALPERPEALHYRDWYTALHDAGFEVAGKDPLAVFLTQISRSPVIRKSTQPGVYELDTGAANRLRDRLDRLHADLRALSATPSAATDLAAVRSRRAQIHAEIGHVEKALVEAEELLGGGRRSPLAAAG
jgi:hypothetical protein